MPGQGFVPSPWDDRRAGENMRGSPLEALSELLEDRFGRITGLAAVVAPLGSHARAAGHWSGAPLHPACHDAVDRDACFRAWQGHLAQFAARPHTHWHRCDQHRFCAVVPVMANGRCLMVCKLVCTECIGENDFLRHLGVLEIVVDSFATARAESLAEWADRQDAVEETMLTPAALPTDLSGCHPQVLKALEYIDRHLSEANLTIARISRHLSINATYLAHLFSTQTGMRATHYIAARRIELAKRLLATTNWQVKRIAYESGHANADWFSQVFRHYAGMSPREYRRAIRGGEASDAARK
jgi:AraC-like DNA-binding protein